MPTLILGFGIGAVAIVQGGIFLFYLALCMLLSGRLFILWKLLLCHSNKKRSFAWIIHIRAD